MNKLKAYSSATQIKLNEFDFILKDSEIIDRFP